MRRFQKKLCSEKARELGKLHGRIERLLHKGGVQEAADLLGDCQQEAISIGETLDENDGEEAAAVHVLEEYCEKVFMLHQDLMNGVALCNGDAVKTLQDCVDKAWHLIDSLPLKRMAVFLPYKASMWDSLESIWQEAVADEGCVAVVIPIPYFEKNSDGSFRKENWEFDRYPEYVPVTDYREFDLGSEHPDMIFIHNPYDGYNHVTTVHPFFYSSKLRNYTDCLVYSPYYATTGGMAEDQSFLPSYLFCDRLVVQSEQIIGFFDPAIPRGKFMPFGSPKFDKVIKLCKNPPEPPEEWKKRLCGRNVFFYNTSIYGLLADTPAFLKKMAYVFDTFKRRDDVCLIWRPHPLLETTLDSLRSDLKAEFEALKKSFVEDEIGILDETPEIEDTIALCDCFIGDSATSVTSLFGVVGKPMFILNNQIYELPGEDDWRSLVGFQVRFDRNDRYCIAMGNRLFTDKECKGQYRYLCDFSDEFAGGLYYGQVAESSGKVVVFPVNGQRLLVVDPDGRRIRKIELQHRLDKISAFIGAFNLPLSEHPEVWYIQPNNYPALVRFNAETEKVDYLEDQAFGVEFGILINDWGERVQPARFFWQDEIYSILNDDSAAKQGNGSDSELRIMAPDGMEYVCEKTRMPKLPGIDLPGSKLVCIDKTGRRLRAVQLDTFEVQEREIGLDGMYFTAIWDERDAVWFLPYMGTALGKWTLSEDRWEQVDAGVEGILSINRPQRKLCDEWYFGSGIVHDGKLILAPKWGNKFVELDITTNKAKEWSAPFPWTIEDKSVYLKNNGFGCILRDIYDHAIMYYNEPERMLYKINMDSLSAEKIERGFDRAEIISLAGGFHKESQWLPYCCFEDAINTLSDIVEGNIHGPDFDRESQIEAFRSVNASPEGDCGKKVYEALAEFI